ncbi:MAG: integrase core domain-containing protein [Ktedonobacterales bacterium]
MLILDLSRALDAWAYDNHVTLDYIDPGKTTQNGFIESFNRKFCVERLNLHWFRSLPHARQFIAVWWEDYNTRRPHIALQQQTSTAYAQALAT